MSQSDPKSAHVANGHDAHGHDDHAPPRLAEPESPMWLPILGAVLFALGGIAFLMLPPINPVVTPAVDTAAAAPAASGSAAPSDDVKRFIQGHVPAGH